jgi:prevent-host-death family protein
MPQTRPVSDLSDKFTEISRIVHEEREPVFLTKDGREDMVVMDIEDYRENNILRDIDAKLLEACAEVMATDKRRTHDKVMAHMPHSRAYGKPLGRNICSGDRN